MSTKKKKGLILWSACDSCNSIIAQKDGIIHREKSCPPDFQSWLHSFITDEKLYASLELHNLQEKNLDSIPKENRNEFILLPFHVLQLCKIPLGDPVVVKINDVIFVKLAWAKQEKFSDFSVSLSAEVGDLYNVQPNSPVVVSKIHESTLPADKIILNCLNEIDSVTSGNLLNRLHLQNSNKVFCVGNKILIRNFGQKIVFQIVKIMSAVEELGVNKFYITTPDTKWNLSENENKLKNSNLLKKLGGLGPIISELEETVSFTLTEGNNLSDFYKTRGILIHGPPGTGKTTLMEAIAEHCTKNIIRIESTKVFSKFIGETEKVLQNYFAQAKEITPSVILIDDLDVLCSTNSSSELEKRIVATLALQMDGLNRETHAKVIILGTTSKIHQIDKTLRCPGRFGKEIEIHVPSSPQRYEILKLLLADVNHCLEDDSVKKLADLSHGFVGADLMSLVSTAILKNYKNGGGENLSVSDFEWALGKVKPSAMREIMIEVPDVRWDDIGGQDELKLKLRQCVEWPLKYKEAFSKLGITPPKGVLMFGPPGCSKTMIAKALATESKLNFISVKGPELFSKWVGESERAVRKVFRRARQTAPSIVFFDELDAIGGERNISSGSNVQERVLAQLLTELDGVEPLDNVTIIAATNRLDRIDPALIRPGRLDRIIYVPLPDEKTRGEIFRLQLKKTSVNSDVNAAELVAKTEGYSGAEIIAVCREAALKALEESLSAELVGRKHFQEALNIVVPRTPKSLLNMYDKYLMK